MIEIEKLFDAAHHPIMMRAPAGSTVADLRGYFEEHRAPLREQLERHAGVLFRGFNVTSSTDFASVAACFPPATHFYIGGNSPRTHLGGNVYTSTEYPASERISLHNEMSYLPAWPAKLLFQCALAPATGGQTTLAISADVLADVPLPIRDLLETRKLCYIRTMQSNDFLGKGWKTTYGTSDKLRVEETVRAQGSTFTWLAKDVLQVRTQCEPFSRHPSTGQQVWFNQAEQWHPSALNSDMRGLIQDTFGRDGFPHDCRFGDGAVIPDAVMVDIRSVLKRNALLFEWQAGDVLLLDNVLAMHGREAFTGAREVRVYLTS